MIVEFDTINIGKMEGNPMKQFYKSPLVTVLQIKQSDIFTTNSTENPIFVDGEIKDVDWEE